MFSSLIQAPFSLTEPKALKKNQQILQYCKILQNWNTAKKNKPEAQKKTLFKQNGKVPEMHIANYSLMASPTGSEMELMVCEEPTTGRNDPFFMERSIVRMVLQSKVNCTIMGGSHAAHVPCLPHYHVSLVVIPSLALTCDRAGPSGRTDPSPGEGNWISVSHSWTWELMQSRPSPEPPWFIMSICHPCLLCSPPAACWDKP